MTFYFIMIPMFDEYLVLVLERSSYFFNYDFRSKYVLCMPKVI